MTTDDATDVRGVEMSRAEIDQALEELGHGVLSLARAGEAYAVPVSFGYDGDRLFLYLIRFGEESEKMAFAEGTERACLTAYRVDSRFDWLSVVLRGPLVEVPEGEAEYAKSVMDDNAWFPSIFPPTAPVTGVRRTELWIEEASGRKGEENQ